MKRALMFVAFIVMATYALNFIFGLWNYAPKVYEPKDFERELLMKKLEEAGQKSGEIPKNQPLHR